MTLRLPTVRDPVTNDVFSIFRCGGCGIGQTVPQPESLARYYGSPYYGNRHGATHDFCLNRRRKLVLSAGKVGAGKRLLDVGCGDASFIRHMRNSGWDVAGTEINPATERMQSLTVRKRIADFSGEPPFDCITMWHTLEHMTDPRATLEQARNVLNPGGRLIIAVPNNGSLQARIFGGNWLHLDVPRHLFHFDNRSLKRCLETSGFEITRETYQELEYDLFGWVQSALNSVFARPNIFFDYLRGSRAGRTGALVLSNLVLGSFLAALFLPAVIVERLLGRSGTVIIVAGKRTERRQ